MNSDPFFSSDKDPFGLSSIYVSRKLSSVTTDYIHPTVEIIAIEFNETMIYGLNTINYIAIKCLGLDRACH